MATSNRAALLTKMHKVLKRHYEASLPDPDQPLLEQLLFACCLENARYEPAKSAFAALRTTFFDWNEVRVSSIKELSEVLHGLPEPAAAATHLRGALQAVFETTYSFELDSLKKTTQGQAIQKLEKLPGVTPFAVAYVTQAALGGHAIPIDRGALEALLIVGVINEAQQAAGEVPGLERAIPKNKGAEFGSLLHQLGADLVSNPFSPTVHKVLLDIAPDAKDRLPKRQTKKPPEPPRVARPAKIEAAPAAKKKSATEAPRPADKKPSRPAPAAPAAKSRAKAAPTQVKRKPR